MGQGGSARDGSDGSLPGRLAFAVERSEFLVGESNVGGGDVLFQMRDLRRAGDGQHDRAALEQPGERDLAGRGAMTLGDVVEQRAGPGESAACRAAPTG